MNDGYSFLTQDKLKTYCKERRIDLTLADEDETINVDHIRVLEMVNFCFFGDFQSSVEIVNIFNDILEISNNVGEGKLAVKVLYYRLRVCFVLNKCNINESNEVILELFSEVLLVFSNIQANPELRESLESLWNVDKPASSEMMEDYKKRIRMEKLLMEKQKKLEEMKKKLGKMKKKLEENRRR